MPLTVLHLAPHPDDEAIGAPATLLALRDAGHRIVNLACSLGGPGQHARRERELRLACDRAGFELVIPGTPVPLCSGDDFAAAEALLTAAVAEQLDRTGADLVVGPSPHDGHHGHEVVGRAARRVLEGHEEAVRWWMWGLWADLPLPTLFSGFDRRRMATALHVLAAHEGEIERNDYLELLPARGVVNRIVGSERVFGFGASMRTEPYAELLTETVAARGTWPLGRPRALDPADPFAEPVDGAPIGSWLREPSVRQRLSSAAPAGRTRADVRQRAPSG